MEAWSKTKLKINLNPIQRGVPLVSVHCQLPEIHLCQHTRIFTLLPDRKSWQQNANFGKFNSIQFFLFHHARNTSYSFECVYVSEIAWHLLSVPYIQNNLHKRTIVFLIGLDWCRGVGKERGARGGDGEKGKRHGQLWFVVREVRGWAGCQDRRERVGWGVRTASGAWVGGGVRGRTGHETDVVSAALPDFDCLIDTSRHHVWSSLVEICKRGKQLFRCNA